MNRPGNDPLSRRGATSHRQGHAPQAAEPLSGTESRASEVSGTAVDVAQTQRAEETEQRILSEREARTTAEQVAARLRLLLEHAPDATLVVGQSGLILLVNAQTEQLLGYQRKELVGLSVDVLVPEARRLAHCAERATFLVNPSRREMGSRLQLSARRKDGREIPVEISLSPLRWDDDSMVVIASIRDATAHRVLEEERTRLFEAEHAARQDAEVAQSWLAFLAEAGALLAQSLDYETTLRNLAHLTVPTLADMCIIDLLDDEGKPQRVAVAHHDLARQRLADELRRFPPDPKLPGLVSEVLAGGPPALRVEYGADTVAFKARSPQHRAVVQALGMRSLIVVPLTARERVLGALSLIHTDSGRRYTADDLQHAQMLANRAALAVDSARLHQRVQETLRSRDDVISSLAHDVRNPLTAVRAYAEVMERYVILAREGREAMALRASRQIQAAAIRITRMTDELLDLTRLQAGQRLTLDQTVLDLTELVCRVVDQHPEGLQRLRLEQPGVSLMGSWDAARLERVLDNLLSNGLKYSAGDSPVRIFLAEERDVQGDWAVLRVEDRGIGIPAADLPRLFHLFHRGANAVGRVRGVGIGLAGTRQIVEQHGGTIAAISVEGEGSTFTVRLPLLPTPARL